MPHLTVRARGGLHARPCFALGVTVLVVFNVARSVELLGPPIVSASVLTASMVLIAWLCGASRGDLGLDAARVGSGLKYGAAAAGVVLVVLLVAALLPTTNTFLHDTRAEIAGGRLLYQLVVTITLFTAIPEELAFRGVLLGSGLRLWRPRTASAVSSLLFGLWHIAPTLQTMQGNAAVSGASATPLGEGGVVLGAVAVTFVAGLVFCWLRLRSQSLVAPVLAHLATNGLALVVAWVAVH